MAILRTHNHRRLEAVGAFTLHFLEMCAVMCVGAVLLSLAVFGAAAAFGFSNLSETSPELSTALIAINLAVPMAVYMRMRGHEWRPTLEMSGTSIIVGVLLVSAFWAGVLSTSSLLEWQLRLACPAMLVPMLLRIDMYSGRGGGGSTPGVARG